MWVQNACWCAPISMYRLKTAASATMPNQALLPTIHHLIEKRAAVILCSHLGRPKGRMQADLRLDPVADRISALLDMEVKKTDDCIGHKRKTKRGSGRGQNSVLENTRFHPQEKANAPEFAKALARHADCL